jgi:hypothetical protein
MGGYRKVGQGRGEVTSENLAIGISTATIDALTRSAFGGRALRHFC